MLNDSRRSENADDQPKLHRGRSSGLQAGSRPGVGGTRRRWHVRKSLPAPVSLVLPVPVGRAQNVCMAPKTGASLSCNTVFSVRFLSPGVNVLRRGFRHGVNLCSGPEVSRANGVRTVCEGRAKPLRRGLPSGANEMRMPVCKRMRFPCVVLSRLSVHSVRMACPRLCVCRHANVVRHK